MSMKIHETVSTDLWKIWLLGACLLVPVAVNSAENQMPMDHGSHGSAHGGQHEAMSTDGDSHGSHAMHGQGMSGQQIHHRDDGGNTHSLRDPHAYSGGYHLDAGAYALDGPRQLRLADEKSLAMVSAERLEILGSGEDLRAAMQTQAWYGRSYNRALIKNEAHYDNAAFEDWNIQLLWSHAFSAFWDSLLGVSHNGGVDDQQTSLAIGIQGLAPYWFETDIMFYVAQNGNFSVDLELEYELLFTQRLILQPSLEAHVDGQDDPGRNVGAGLSEVKLGTRLRYEISRKFAPYMGIEWSTHSGKTHELAGGTGESGHNLQMLAGLRVWF